MLFDEWVAGEFNPGVLMPADLESMKEASQWNNVVSPQPGRGSLILVNSKVIVPTLMRSFKWPISASKQADHVWEERDNPVLVSLMELEL